MNFHDIIGQSSIKQHLLKTVNENRISHAQLFLGNPGYGTLPLALAYAKYIMCENPGPEDACGTCSSCSKINKYEHPDLHFVFPTIGTKSNTPLISDDYISQWREFILNNPYRGYDQWLSHIDAGNQQGIIKVREAESIVRKLSLKSFESEYKVMIIWYPEKMNGESANKLLKLIEEPPQKTIFLLVSENSELIINTIKSRTQLVKVPRLKEDDLTAGLQRKSNLDEEKARNISHMSEGNVNRAYDFIEASADNKQNFELFTELMRKSYMGKFSELIPWVDELSKIGREKQKTFLSYSLRMVRENLMMNQKLTGMARVNDDEGNFSAKFSSFIHPQNTPKISEELQKAHYHVTRNANPKVVFLDLCIQLNRLLKVPVE